MIDHLVYATPDLAATVADLERRLGIRLSPGGPHVGLGTRNHLADLGDGAYLEVVGPDPEQPDPELDRPFGVDHLAEPRLLTWAATVTDLDGAVRSARERGLAIGPITPMSRDRADGVRLHWRLAMPHDDGTLGGVVPFLIDWSNSPHPSASAARGLRLVSLTALHPDVSTLERRLALLGVGADAVVREAAQPALRAVIKASAGEIEL